MMWKHKIKAVIFDNDGVLIDTIQTYADANSHVIGKPFPRDLLKRTNGRKNIEVCQILKDEFNLDLSPEEISEKRFSILQKTLPNVKLIKGVEPIVAKFKEMGIKMSVATSSSREHHNVKTQFHQKFYENFEEVVVGDDVKFGKPDPEVFLKAAESFKEIKPENILVFEDAPSGVLAANNAGMAVAMLNETGYSQDEFLSDLGATANVIFTSWNEFDFKWFDWEPTNAEDNI